MITKTRKQGNSIMLTVPKEFDVPNGVEVEAKLVENGILYEFVEPKKEFFDFSEDILADILSEGYRKQEILKEFRNRKNALTSAFKSIAEDTVANSKPMTKEELAAEIGL
ncbi:AbrB family transcriptional regulator [Enterococcus faecium]|nr:AbrB family transcriptional regulator [Enterococcus faecium]